MNANGIYPAHHNDLNPSLDQNGLHGPFGQQFSAPTASPSNFDFGSQFPNQQSQRFPDGLINNTSPGIHQSPFQVPSVVPQKRTRDDQVGASPHPPQSTLGQSRSQTPSQTAFNQYGAQSAGQNFSTPTPFQPHLQASNHATPSPHQAGQQFRPPSSQPNMSSPQNFPAQNHQAPNFPQMPNQMNRMSTPQNNNNHFIPGMQPSQGGMRQMPGQMPNMPNQMSGQQGMSSQQQEMFNKYQQAMMMRQQQMRSMGQAPPAGQPNGMTPQQRAAMAGGMNPAMAAKMGMAPGGDRGNPQHQAMQFISQLNNFVQSQGKQLDNNPTVVGHPMHYFHLFQLYIRFKPDRQPQNWPIVMQSLRIPLPQHTQAMQELSTLYDRNLSAFARHYVSMVERQRQMQQGRIPGQGSPTSEQGPRPALPPNLPAQPAQAQASSAGSPAPAKDRARAASSAAPDGLDRSTPTKAASVAASVGSPHQFPQGSPVPLKIGTQEDDDDKPDADSIGRIKSIDKADELRKLFDPEYKPRRHSLNTHGGLPLDHHIAESGAALYDSKTLPKLEELGPVDLQALTLGLQSGFHEEVAYALDRLAVLSQKPLFLRECLDLADALLDIGRQQLHRLIESTDPSAEFEVLPVEKLTSSSREENLDFREERPFAGPQYEKRHAIDKLLAITTIFRNLSFPLPERHNNTDVSNEHNRQILTTSDMQSFAVKIIRLLNSSVSPLQSDNDRLDFAKDLVIFLSNVSETLAISNEDDARAFLLFLISFAPGLAPACGQGKIAFTTYEPLKHQYLPSALDSLAKILARDEPNRGLIRTILQNDLSTVEDQTQSCFTKVFALAIAPLPDKPFNTPASAGPLRLVEKRKPFITQGMLLLDILSTLVPAPTSAPTIDRTVEQHCLQRQWLESEDAWASRVIHLVIAMGMHDAHNPHVERHPVTHEPVSGGHGFTSISQRALSMIRRLLEAADKADVEAGKAVRDLVSSRVLGSMPLDDMTFAAIMLPRFDAEVIRGLTALSQMVS